MSLRDDLQAALGSTHTIERELGGGGMSRLFVGEETAFGRKVAVKVLAPEAFSFMSRVDSSVVATILVNRSINPAGAATAFRKFHTGLDDPGFDAVLRRMGVERCQLKPSGRLSQ